MWDRMLPNTGQLPTRLTTTALMMREEIICGWIYVHICGCKYVWLYIDIYITCTYIHIYIYLSTYPYTSITGIFGGWPPRLCWWERRSSVTECICNMYKRRCIYMFVYKYFYIHYMYMAGTCGAADVQGVDDEQGDCLWRDTNIHVHVYMYIYIYIYRQLFVSNGSICVVMCVAACVAECVAEGFAFLPCVLCADTYFF